jgi:predicted RNA-binding Zn ribbon-like protein
MANAPGRDPSIEFVAAVRRDAALDFANTLAWRGSLREESLGNFESVLAWALAAAAAPARPTAALRKWFAAHAASRDAAYAEAIGIRETIYAILRSGAHRHSAPSQDLAALNCAIERAPGRIALDRIGDAIGWKIRVRPDAPSILAPILWSAADIIAGADRERVRECANGRCLWLFLDDSKNGTRRWCSMQSCGNRAKAHRHYVRTRGSKAGRRSAAVQV